MQLSPYRAIAGVLTYPDGTYRTRIAMAVEALDEMGDESSAVALQRFNLWAGQQTRAQLEEAFTLTFDLNPKCSMEVGWHLFGEEYDRGAFMAEVRGSLRTHGIEEHIELPDHLTHVLQLVEAMSDDEASQFGAKFGLVSIDLMIAALQKIESPYLDVMGIARQLVARRVTAEDLALAAEEAESSAAPEFWTGEMPPDTGAQKGHGGGSRYTPPGMESGRGFNRNGKPSKFGSGKHGLLPVIGQPTRGDT